MRCCKQINQIYQMVSAFSVPKAKRQQKVPPNPGPGQYNPENSPKIVKPVDPHYSFTKQHRKDKVSEVPGPGTYYEKAQSIKQSSPHYTLLPRRKSGNSSENLTVGPGQYDPSLRYCKNASPSYSLTGRNSLDDKGSKVGPAQYNIKGYIEMMKLGNRFPQQLRQTIEKRVGPGPGAYQYQKSVRKWNKQAPSYGFGSKRYKQREDEGPGPAAYEKKSSLSKIGGMLCRQLRSSFSLSKTPGPANYSPSSSMISSRKPQWSLPKTPRDQTSKSSLIGPGSYNYDKNYKSLLPQSKGHGFSKNIRKFDISEARDGPGPADYDGKVLKSGRGVHIANRIKDLRRLNVPGPGTYQNEKFDNKSWVQGKDRYSVGKALRKQYETLNVPGPGSYNYNKHPNKLSTISFGKYPKLKQEKRLSPCPGPAQYTLKPTFADVPQYLLPRRAK